MLDPFVEVYVDDERVLKTKKKAKTLNPVYKEEDRNYVDVPIDTQNPHVIKVMVWVCCVGCV